MPLPLTVLQILAIDLGTETLPALALGREPAEPGPDAPPAPAARRERSSTGGCCCAPGAVMGSVSAVLPRRSSWSCGAPAGARAPTPGPGTPLHHAYLQATTMTFAGIVACQIGTAFAARTDRASLRTDRAVQQSAAAGRHRLRARSSPRR